MQYLVRACELSDSVLLNLVWNNAKTDQDEHYTIIFQAAGKTKSTGIIRLKKHLYHIFTYTIYRVHLHALLKCSVITYCIFLLVCLGIIIHLVQ